MQEELHKWRRKDPITVRRSMARPGASDKLIEGYVVHKVSKKGEQIKQMNWKMMFKLLISFC